MEVAAKKIVEGASSHLPHSVASEHAQKTMDFEPQTCKTAPLIIHEPITIAMLTQSPRPLALSPCPSPSPPLLTSTHLRIREVHLGMTLLKLLQHLQLPLLLTRRLPHLLLPLIIHHLLHHPSRLAVQIPQLAVLGLDLRGVEEVRGVAGDGRPPLLLVGFVEVDGDVFAGGGGLERPGGF